jgi:ferredoxin
MKKPVVEISDCIRCGICVDVCPSVFFLNEVNFIQITELTLYPVSEVDEAIKNCPAKCIFWQND